MISLLCELILTEHNFVDCKKLIMPSGRVQPASSTAAITITLASMPSVHQIFGIARYLGLFGTRR
jgi:hypothetical protein